MDKKYDFAGWATKADMRCSDGRLIAKDAFAHQDGAKVPIVWNHNHATPDSVLGIWNSTQPGWQYACGMLFQ